ncbi:MAG: hypothetical protein ACI9YE_003521, partial [Psychroserpens sp.]
CAFGVKVINKNSGGNPNSHTPAHESSAAVASSLPFNEIHYLN